MFSEIVVHVKNLSKCYQIYDNPRDRLKQFILPHLQRFLGLLPKKYFREFWALKNIDFAIKKGETIGIIGRNGSGKSTLLQLICGTLNPTTGSIQGGRRTAALLELGAGFNPEFSGRENIYMNGAVLGLTRGEIDERYSDIISFADIGAFVERPVKTYSSGMLVRLAFAVAVHVDAEILIVDEALAVGDISFQHKCYKKIEELRTRGVTILLASHDLGSIVEFCNRAFLLNSGEIIFQGRALDAVNKFKELMSISSIEGELKSSEDVEHVSSILQKKKFLLSSVYEISAEKYEYQSGVAKIFDWGILSDDKTSLSAFEAMSSVEILVLVRFISRCADPIVGYFITDAKGREIVGTNTHYEDVLIGPKEAGSEVCISFKQRLGIAPGEYFMNIGCSEYVGDDVVAHHRIYRVASFIVYSSKKFVGMFGVDTKINISDLTEI